MEQWAAVAASSLLLVVTLAGGIMTLMRAERISRRAMTLAAVACLTLLAWMFYQLVWWLMTVPAQYTDAEIAAGAGHSDAGTLLTGVVISIAVALLFAAVIVGADRPGAHAAPTGGRATQAQVQAQAQAQAQVNGYAQRSPAGAAGDTAGSGQPVTAQAAGGWTPPQQAQPNDWNIQSGVWSIPRGIFDGPPPEDPGRR
jgi:hypothetical protein